MSAQAWQAVAGRAADDPLPRVVGLSPAVVAQFRELYRAEFPQLLRYCERVVQDRAQAADLTQEAFTRLFARWRGVREPRDYLFLVLTNLIRNHWRSLGRERAAMARLGDAPVQQRGFEQAQAVRDAVERLPKRLREVVLLHYFADCSVEDLAGVLERPVGTVKRQLHEARQLLHAEWEG